MPLNTMLVEACKEYRQQLDATEAHVKRLEAELREVRRVLRLVEWHENDMGEYVCPICDCRPPRHNHVCPIALALKENHA